VNFRTVTVGEVALAIVAVCMIILTIHWT